MGSSPDFRSFKLPRGRYVLLPGEDISAIVLSPITATVGFNNTGWCIDIKRFICHKAIVNKRMKREIAIRPFRGL